MNTDRWWAAPAQALDQDAAEAARQRQDQLTKPPGSLGRLEAVAIELAAMQGRPRPAIQQPWITVFAGDHGVVEEGVAAFPQAVTQQMLANFVAGGAAIAVLARELGAHLEVVDAGTLAPAPLAGVVWDQAGPGTANLAAEPAMTPAQLEHALGAGQRAVARARAAGADLFAGGEMGIGNTTAAAALACGLLGLRGADLAGPGTGLDAAGVAHKAAVIDRALALHGFIPSPDGGGWPERSGGRVRGASEGRLAGVALTPSPSPTGGGEYERGSPGVQADDPSHARDEVLVYETLRRLGGFEIAALAGAYLACAQAGLPALVDGYITSAAALAACRLNPGVRDWLLFSHASAEPGHARLIQALAARPLLQLDMRLGEGSGAAAAIPLLRLACALHAGMATFQEAGVSGGS